MSTATLAEMREAREKAASEAERLKQVAARRWHALRVLLALVAILAAYWIGYESGLVAALRK